MPYRDDREALELRVRELERENERLRDELDAEQARRMALTQATHERRHSEARAGCVLCGGTLLPVAVFAGHDIQQPLPLNISTLRFGRPAGGFTHSAPIHSMACASCGFIHSFISMDTPGAGIESSEETEGEPVPPAELPDPVAPGEDES